MKLFWRLENEKQKSRLLWSMRNAAQKSWKCRLFLNLPVGGTAFHTSSSQCHITTALCGDWTRALAGPGVCSGAAAICPSVSYSNSVCNVPLSPLEAEETTHGLSPVRALQDGLFNTGISQLSSWRSQFTIGFTQFLQDPYVRGGRLYCRSFIVTHTRAIYSTYVKRCLSEQANQTPTQILLPQAHVSKMTGRANKTHE